MGGFYQSYSLSTQQRNIDLQACFLFFVLYLKFLFQIHFGLAHWCFFGDMEPPILWTFDGLYRLLFAWFLFNIRERSRENEGKKFEFLIDWNRDITCQWIIWLQFHWLYWNYHQKLYYSAIMVLLMNNSVCRQEAQLISKRIWRLRRISALDWQKQELFFLSSICFGWCQWAVQFGDSIQKWMHVMSEETLYSFQ